MIFSDIRKKKLYREAINLTVKTLFLTQTIYPFKFYLSELNFKMILLQKIKILYIFGVCINL